MKRTIFLLLAFGVFCLFSACSENNFLIPGLEQSDQVTSTLKSAQKPAPKLTAVMELVFSDTNPPIFWTGTLDFGDDNLYGIRFISYLPPRDFSQASPFAEYFEIYNLFDPSIVYLGGPDAGVNTLANNPPEPNKFRMNGKIEVAIDPFALWMDRHVHMSGTLYWLNYGTPENPILAPDMAIGNFRIN